MKVVFTHTGGWSGGGWRYNGLSRSDFMRLHGFDPTVVKGMTGTIKWDDEEGDQQFVVSEDTLTVNGVDHDHGHEYPWSYEEPSFILAKMRGLPIPASLIWRNRGIITLEMS
jgi:hypothetical protein